MSPPAAAAAIRPTPPPTLPPCHPTLPPHPPARPPAAAAAPAGAAHNTRNGSPTPAPAAHGRPAKKVQMCRNFPMGRCHHGSNCRFSHEDTSSGGGSRDGGSGRDENGGGAGAGARAGARDVGGGGDRDGGGKGGDGGCGRGGAGGVGSTTPPNDASVLDLSTESAMAQVSEFRLAAERAECRLYDEFARVAVAERRAEVAERSFTAVTLDMAGAIMRAEEAEAAATLSAARAEAAELATTRSDALVSMHQSEATAAQTRARRLEGDPQSLRACSLEELRGLVGDIERSRDNVRDALSREESRAAAESLALADSLVCCICHEQRKSTALNCGHLLCGRGLHSSTFGLM